MKERALRGWAASSRGAQRELEKEREEAVREGTVQGTEGSSRLPFLLSSSFLSKKS